VVGTPGDQLGAAKIGIDGFDRAFLVARRFLTQNFFGPRELVAASLVDGDWKLTELGPVDSTPDVSVAAAPDGFWIVAVGHKPHVQTLPAIRSKPTWLYRYSAAQGWAPPQIAIEPVENCQLSFCSPMDALAARRGQAVSSSSDGPTFP